MGVVQRMVEIQQESGLSQRAFETSINKSSGYLNQLQKNNSMPSIEVVLKILEVYPKYNLNWLITGSGHKLNTESTGFDFLPDQVQEKETAYKKGDGVNDDEVLEALRSFIVNVVKEVTDPRFDRINDSLIMLLKRNVKNQLNDLKNKDKRTG